MDRPSHRDAMTHPIRVASEKKLRDGLNELMTAFGIDRGSKTELLYDLTDGQWPLRRISLGTGMDRFPQCSTGLRPLQGRCPKTISLEARNKVQPYGTAGILYQGTDSYES